MRALLLPAHRLRLRLRWTDGERQGKGLWIRWYDKRCGLVCIAYIASSGAGLLYVRHLPCFLACLLGLPLKTRIEKRLSFFVSPRVLVYPLRLRSTSQSSPSQHGLAS